MPLKPSHRVVLNDLKTTFNGPAKNKSSAVLELTVKLFAICARFEREMRTKYRCNIMCIHLETVLVVRDSFSILRQGLFTFYENTCG